MHEYRNMEIIELARELNTLKDEDFKLLIRDLDGAQLKEVMNHVSIEKKLRIVQEMSYRKETFPTTREAIPQVVDDVPLKVVETLDGLVPTPNVILRSSLFSASKTHGAISEAIRDFEIITHGDNVEIYLTAFRLFNQLDLDLLIELIKLQQEKKGLLLKITARQLAIKSRHADNAQTYLALKEQLELFQNASIKIKHGRYEFVGSILTSAYFDSNEQLYIIKFNSDLQPLFLKNNWTGIDVQIRKELRTNLSKWLHGFYSTHVNSSTPIKLETIFNLSGATDKKYQRWVNETLVKALEDMKEVFIKNGKKFNYKIIGDKLYVHKSQTNSQNKNSRSKILSLQS